MVFGSPNLGKPHLKVDLLYQLVPYLYLTSKPGIPFSKEHFLPQGQRLSGIHLCVSTVPDTVGGIEEELGEGWTAFF